MVGVGIGDAAGLYRLGDRWAFDGDPLHCGDRLQIRVGGRWVEARIEFEDRVGWILVVADGARILVSHSLSVRRMPSF